MTSAAPYVLVVDDDHDIRETLEAIFNSCDVPVKTAKDGAEALSVLRRGPQRAGLILLDVMMPGMNGFEFRAEQLRDENLKSVPTVIMSGGGNLETRAAVMGLPAYRKPLDLRALLALVQTYLPRAPSG